MKLGVNPCSCRCVKVILVDKRLLLVLKKDFLRLNQSLCSTITWLQPKRKRQLHKLHNILHRYPAQIIQINSTFSESRAPSVNCSLGPRWLLAQPSATKVLLGCLSTNFVRWRIKMAVVPSCLGSKVIGLDRLVSWVRLISNVSPSFCLSQDITADLRLRWRLQLSEWGGIDAKNCCHVSELTT